MPANTIYFQDELDSVLLEVWKKYPETKYSTIFPMSTNDDPGALNVGYTQYNEIGMSEIIANLADDSVTVDVEGERIIIPVYEIGNHYSYSNWELESDEFARRKKMGSVGLETARAMASARSVEVHHDEIAILADADGSKKYGKMQGLVYHPNVTKVAAVAGADSGATIWSGKTPTEILKDITDQRTLIIKNTKGVYRPDTIVLPDDELARLESTPRSADNDTSILTWLKANLPGITFETHHLLSDVSKNPSTGVPGFDGNVMLMYKKEREVFAYKKTAAYDTYEPVNEGRGYRVEAYSRSAGVEVIQPLAIVVFYGF